ncbi:cation:proton antiporter [Klebsiella sp. PL-2018]|uniref:cation:proton antiporter n=1 Tax=Klebsiella sp. PL-2018 TaxID=2851540 RepID=UPI001C22DB70|nr:cation:proton antiporter [Klebsiella sp. PL-2018]QXD00104.1 Na(+)/H(+) antiporter [Klebsiella sp. PL-2018]
MNAENSTLLGSYAEHITFFILIQIVTILVFSKIVSFLARKLLGQTNVAGEILAGILLGPSFLASLFPGIFNIVFTSDTSIAFIGLSQIGLIFLMFQIGMEFDFSRQLKGKKSAFVLISTAGITFPFIIGFFTADYFWEILPDPKPDLLGFKLFFAVAMSITAIPILGRIFMELNYSGTRIATLIISAAAIDDVLGWLLLGTITALVTSSFNGLVVIQNIFLLFLFSLTVFFIGSRLISPYIERLLKNTQQINSIIVFYIVSGLLVSAIITSYLGVYAIIGGFIFGLSLHKNRNFVHAWNVTIGRFVNVFFLPLFFAYTGLKTNIGLLSEPSDIMLCIVICLLAFVGKFGGTYLASRFVGETHKNSLIIGFSTNTRALMELIVLNVGYDLGLLPQKIFTMLVIMAVVSTFMITPILKALLRNKEDSPQAVQLTS